MSKPKPKIYIRDRVYVPKSSVPDMDALKEAYTFHLFKESACAQCEYKQDRPCAVCDTCPNYTEVLSLWRSKMIAGRGYIGLPVGDKKYIERRTGVMYEDHTLIDKRVYAPLQYPIKFLIELRPHQKTLVEDFLRHKYGLLEAPPRTGKTVLMLYIGLQLGQRMLLLANQHEYLQQFLWHIEGNVEEGIPKCTNLPEIQKKYGKKLYGFPKTDEDFRSMQFMVMTYQQFLSEKNGKNRLALLAKQIGTVAVDEAHKVGATTFASVLGKFPTAYRFGVTGTVQRKDGRHKITKRILGPVSARATIEAMVPKVFIKDTGIKLRSDPKLWVYKMKKLADSEPRNKLIVERCLKDVARGHSVVIPLTFTKHIHNLVRLINQAAGKKIAEPFVGGGSDKQKRIRQDILARAKRGETKVIVGTRSLLQLGLNVPRWSAIYTVIPISNKPNYKQETARICTPMDGKRQPIIRLFYDSAMPASVACARNCLQHMKEFKYMISKDANTQKSVQILSDWKSRGGRRSGGLSSGSDDFSPEAMFRDDEERTSLGRARAGRI